MKPQIRRFLRTRALSTLGDDLWLVAVPIYLASQSRTSGEMGVLSSLGAFATILGFLLAPLIIRKCGSKRTALFSDGLQVVSLVFFIAFYLLKLNFLKEWLVPFFYLVTFFSSALWFSSSESVLAESTSKSWWSDRISDFRLYIFSFRHSGSGYRQLLQFHPSSYRITLF